MSLDKKDLDRYITGNYGEDSIPNDEDAQLDDRDFTLEQIQKKCYETAKFLGWAEREIPIPEMIALIHSEASEALEEYRKDKPISYNAENGKPEGIASEFADIVIRVCHYAEVLGIDLQKEVLRKLAYNRTRGYRHGGLKA